MEENRQLRCYRRMKGDVAIIGGKFHILTLSCIDISMLTLRVWETSSRGELKSGSILSIYSGQSVLDLY